MSDIRIKELVCAFLVGSLLDTDHFVAGLYVHHALSLQAATALPSRPGGHALLFVLIAMVSVDAAKRRRCCCGVDPDVDFDANFAVCRTCIL